MLVRLIDRTAPLGGTTPPARDDPPRQRDLSLRIHDPEATVADLVAVLVPEACHPPALRVDGRPVLAATPLDRAGFRDGITLELVDHTASTSAPPAVAGTGVIVEVEAGPASGRRVHLPPGTHLVGRTPSPGAAPEGPQTQGPPTPHPTLEPAGKPALELEDPSVSIRHARIDVTAQGTATVTDLGSTNGTRQEPQLEVGRSRLSIRPADADRTDREVRSGPVHRGPRSVPPPPPLPPPPEGVPALPAATPIGVVALAGSLTVGVVMVVVLGSLTYALFALLGPLLILGHSADSRLRRRRARRRNAARRREALATFESALARAARQERRRRDLRHPGLVECRRRAETGLGLWERRPHDPDAFAFGLGIGAGPWPDLADHLAHLDPEPDLADAVASHLPLTDTVVGTQLAAGTAVALVGPRSLTRAVARSALIQLATLHGPADLACAVLTGPETARLWDWCRWLPHSEDEGSLLAADDAGVSDVVSRLVAPPAVDLRAEGGSSDAPRASDRLTVCIVDDEAAPTTGRGPVPDLLRALPERPVAALVLVDHAHQVPAVCRTLIQVHPDATLTGPGHLVAGRAVMTGAPPAVATGIARRLARWDDPELDGTARRLPDRCSLVDLIGPHRLQPGAVGARWGAAHIGDRPRVILGLAQDGPVELDLVADGPHILIAGSTGSGKSELLRTLVLGLAADHPPDHLSFILIDFKGGATFDRCAELPHVVGVATDLDAHDAERALRSLEAEIRHREEVVRAAGVSDFDRLGPAGGTGHGLARLVVVIDEYAALAHELPDLVPGLVGLAQRGRSLGMHLVLATQRPGAAVTDDLRANISVRIALRVQSTTDSCDVIDGPEAARLPRSRPGRAVVRLGPGDLRLIQTASTSGSALRRPAPITVAPLTILGGDGPHRGLGLPHPGEARSGDDTEDLSRVVEHLERAWSTRGVAPPRRPWTDPLPALVDWPLDPALATASGYGEDHPGRLVLGLADEPDRQRRVPHRWDLDAGPLLVVGLPGSGVTDVAATAVLAAARRWGPEECHVHVLDHGAGHLAPLAGLPQVGAVVTAGDEERTRRLLGHLAGELNHRRSRGEDRPRRLLVIDGLGALRSGLDQLDPAGPWSHLEQLVSGGTEVGIHVLMGAEGVGAAPHGLVSRCHQRLIMRLGDAADHSTFGVPAHRVPSLGRGRGIEVEGLRLVQVARPLDGLAAAVARLATTVPTVNTPPGPEPVCTLPSEVMLDDLPSRVRAAPFGGTLGAAADDLAGGPDPSRTEGPSPSPPERGPRSEHRVELLFAMADADLSPVHLELTAGSHVLVAGPARSGRTGVLDVLATSARRAGMAVVRVLGHPGTSSSVGLDADDPALAEAVEQAGPLLVLVDDADLTPDQDRVLSALVAPGRGDRHVVAAGRTDRLRRGYGHWTREIRVHRLGLLLMPDPDLDGELLSVQVPRRGAPNRSPGRGWLVTPRQEGFVQVARSV